MNTFEDINVVNFSLDQCRIKAIFNIKHLMSILMFAYPVLVLLVTMNRDCM